MAGLTPFTRWLQLKRYQFEVTISLNMYTPGEKFVFYSVTFLLGSLLLIAIILYLPQHIAFLINRAWFYAHGDSVDVVGVAKDKVHTFAQSALQQAGTATAAGAAQTFVKEL